MFFNFFPDMNMTMNHFIRSKTSTQFRVILKNTTHILYTDMTNVKKNFLEMC